MKRLFVMVALCALTALAQNPQAGRDPYGNIFLGNNKPKNEKDKPATSRAVKGMVTDANGKPLEGALVTLTDGATKDKLTFFTKQDGEYRFDDLSFTKDYKLIASYKGEKSPERTLSQYDHTAKVVRILQIDSIPK